MNASGAFVRFLGYDRLFVPRSQLAMKTPEKVTDVVSLGQSVCVVRSKEVGSLRCEVEEEAQALFVASYQTERLRLLDSGSYEGEEEASVEDGEMEVESDQEEKKEGDEEEKEESDEEFVMEEEDSVLTKNTEEPSIATEKSERILDYGIPAVPVIPEKKRRGRKPTKKRTIEDELNPLKRSKNEVEEMLRRGLFDCLMSNSNENGIDFFEADIDTILKKNLKPVGEVRWGQD